MIQSLIFSKDRACQLDLLLRSIDKNFMHVTGKVHVLWKATTPAFEAGYHRVIERFPNVIMWTESDFKENTKNLLNLMEYVCFFVDDNFVYQPPNILGRQVECVMERVEEAGGFSFRLGLNTIVQDPYTNAIVSPLPVFHNIENLVMAWDWTSIPRNNFGYPFSVDGHVYKASLIAKNIEDVCPNPNALEGRFPIDKIPRGMFSLQQSSVINNPLNLVGSSNNNAGMYHPRSLEELNAKYLEGQQINLDKLCLNEIVGCHQEMEIEFEEQS